MSLDAGFMSKLILEIKNECLSSKMNKIIQDSKNEITLDLYTKNGMKNITFCVGNSYPRFFLNSNKIATIDVPSSFCMLLRKYLMGAILNEVSQIGFDRISEFKFITNSLFAKSEQVSLVFELMGKYSNLYLLDQDDTILGILQPYSMTINSTRVIVPGCKYERPELPPKIDPTDVNIKILHDSIINMPEGTSVYEFIISKIAGMSKITAKEISNRVTNSFIPCVAINFEKEIFSVITSIYSPQNIYNYLPTVLLKDNLPFDYSFIELHGFKDSDLLHFKSCNELINYFYNEKSQSEKLFQKSSNMFKKINVLESRITKKISNQKKEIAECSKSETYKLYGDLISANIYIIKKGVTNVLINTDNYQISNEPSTKDALISLDKTKSPSENAQHYYKKYKKLISRTHHLKDQLIKDNEQLQYIRSVKDSILRSKSISNIETINEELINVGIVKDKNAKNKKNGKKIEKKKYDEYTSPNGYKIYCGSNNISNDYVTFKIARKDDIWFHVKDAPGSHVILNSSGNIPESKDIYFAAMIAAKNSSMHNSNKVTVEYVSVSHIKKPSKSPPGFVTFSTYKTCIVNCKDIKDGTCFQSSST